MPKRNAKNEFPGVEGFSPRSLKYMRALAEAWPEESIVQQLIAQLPWGHNVRVLDRVKDRPTREWYLRAALEHGWSQNVLVLRDPYNFDFLTLTEPFARSGSWNEDCSPTCATCSLNSAAASPLLAVKYPWLLMVDLSI
jgi:predicted nuclease of restriction endonuclease-like (RecB) superfamily